MWNDPHDAAGQGERDERRSLDRGRSTYRAKIKEIRRDPREAVLSDISPAGCGFESPLPIPPGVRVQVVLPGLEPWSGTIIWWHEGRGGIRFCRPLYPAVAARFVA
jgi:hypothetical protein